MTMSGDKQNVDQINSIEKEIGDCKVRIFFSLTANKETERIILENLMLAFDRRIKNALTTVQT